MTLGEGKRKVYMLLDEYSSGGIVEQDPDLEAKMADFFDTAQKQLARLCPVVRTCQIPLVPGQTLYPPPEDLRCVLHLRRGGRAVRCRWRGGMLYIPGPGRETVELEYCAVPATLDGQTPDGYEFEISEDACQCMPFFVAAQQLAADLVSDAGTLLALYDRMTAALGQSAPGEDYRPRQGLYRG